MSQWTALGFLLRRTAANRVRRHVQRLRQPRYALALVVGVGYLLLVATNNRSGRTATDPLAAELAPLLLVAGAIAFALYAWILAQDRRALVFSLAEVAMLFPAPVTRSALVHFKLLRSQLLILLNVGIWLVLVGTPPGMPWWMRAVAIWCAFSTMHLHRLGAAFVRTSLREHRGHGARRRVLVLGVLVAVAALLVVAVAQVAGAVLGAATADRWNALLDALALPIPAAALAPFRAVVAPLTAQSVEAWRAGILPAALILAGHYVWVIRSDTAFEEAAAAASAEHARFLTSRRRGRGLPGAGSYSPPLLPLRPVGPPASALVWKNVTMLLRRRQLRIWTLAFLALLGGVAGVARLSPEIAEAVGAMLLVWGGFLFLIGPQWIRNDLRADLGHLDLLRTFPLAGDAVIRAEAAGAALVLTLGQAALLLAGLVGIAHTLTGDAELFWLGLGASALLLPALNYMGMMLQNGAALLFPGWVRIGGVRGVESLGQHMLGALAHLLALAITLLVPLGAAATVFWLAHGSLGAAAALPAAAAGGALVALEAWLLSVWLGSVYAVTDPPSAGILLE